MGIFYHIYLKIAIFFGEIYSKVLYKMQFFCYNCSIKYMEAE